MKLFLYLMPFLYLIGCKPKVPTGHLLVKATSSGSYEIYRIAGETPLQFVSEEIGNFNESIELPIGSYLILADCSHEMIQIHSGEQKELISHQVNFIPPHDTSSADKFSIQCNRFTKTKSIQSLQNRYSLNILDGRRDLLVGMVPLTIDSLGDGPSLVSKTFSFKLSAIQLSAYEGIKPKTLYFVSPADNIISITEYQEFGNWLYLLPGDYIIEVNGTSSQIHLEELESREIQPAFIHVSTNDKINLDISSNILGTPLYVELNDQHWLDLNETYPVLPGKAQLKLNGSFRTHEVLLTENELINKTVRSIQVDLDCSPWDWDCLGRRKIYLYQGDQQYPFAEGLSDVPILFFENDVWVGIEGSRDIRYHISDKREHSKLKVGNIKFIPQYSYRPGQITDLARIEAIGPPFIGFSLDLPLDQEITVPLIEGKYYLSQYTSWFSQEYERRNARRILTSRQKTLPEIKYTVFVSEKKFKHIKRAEKEKRNKKKKKISKTEDNTLRPFIPVQIY